jgi:biopolymer transport protein ExbD
MLKRPPLFTLANRTLNVESASTTGPEINLIPFIDVLLVILIFLMISTTFTKYQELSITLPSADGVTSSTVVKEITVAINNEGRYAVNGLLIDSKSLAAKLAQTSQNWGTTEDAKTGRVIITADARAPHQAVMNVLEAAREAGLANVVFATQAKTKR